MAYISLNYGPYSCNGTVKHRTSRLMNIVRYLQEKGNEVELRPTIHWDTLEIVISLRVAFKCRLTFLSQLDYRVFGMEHDPVFVRAIEAVEETLSRIGKTFPNIRVPGLYKEMFNIPLNFGAGAIANNDPKLMEGMQMGLLDASSSSSSSEELLNAIERELQALE
ncbi:UNVERIFIED_CONTAM: hypothetical protein PYX00_006947 [Menopon gallinae]|uniref:Uncharacterized protein n=1 Tax=Menopon gallinae TaxID=328185 RepID=A0AAW2HH96_9NEOP